MSRARRTALVVVGVLAAAVVAIVAWSVVDDGSDASGDGVVVDVTRAEAPFRSWTAGTIRVGNRDVRVVVADDDAEQVQGLRGRRGPAPYDGMLFDFGRATTTAFTMAGVPAPLEIAFFDARGRRVDELRMEPCSGSDATCPLYRASGPFRYALETAPGDMPPGRLRVR